MPFGLFAPYGTARLLRRDDGALSLGGTPSLLSGHKTVRMEREVVRLVIGKDAVSVDCRFTFFNDGPAAEVRMGFPDEGQGGDRDDIEPDVAKSRPPKSRLEGFQSYVNGAPVKTTLVRDAKDVGLAWHTKQVVFPARTRVAVRDVYTTTIGGQNTAHGTLLRQASYILRTGASWKGTIGSAEVLVSFQRARPTFPLDPHVIKRDTDKPEFMWRDWTNEPRRVYWNGFAVPTVIDGGRGLRFYRENWKPTDRSDVFLAFDDSRNASG